MVRILDSAFAVATERGVSLLEQLRNACECYDSVCSFLSTITENGTYSR